MEVLQIWVRSLERRILKEAIRKEALRARDQIAESKRQEDSQTIAGKVTGCELFQNSEDIYCYVNIRSEVATGQIIEEAWRLGKRVWLPKVEGKEMAFYRADAYKELEPGVYGILEPSSVDKADGAFGLVIMPGVAFDKECRRIGYGGGYYDRYLSKHPALHTLALAYEVQMQDAVIPCEETDIRPEAVVTECAWYERDKDRKGR